MSLGQMSVGEMSYYPFARFVRAAFNQDKTVFKSHLSTIGGASV